MMADSQFMYMHQEKNQHIPAGILLVETFTVNRYEALSKLCIHKLLVASIKM